MGAIPVILNRNARWGYSADEVARLQEIFARHGLEAAISLVDDGSQIVAAARAALELEPDTIVAAGGDGTVSAVATLLKDTDVTLGVLPMGTLNHFARDVGIPSDVEEAVAAIAAGHRIAIDVGMVNDRPFINNASLGLYPDIVRDRARQQRRLGRGKYWAMFWATHSVLRRSPWLKLRLEIGGKARNCRSPFVFVGNNDYTMEGFDIGTRSTLSDGRLSVYTTQRRTRRGLFGLALRALFGRLRQADDFAIENPSSLRIDASRRRLLVATDGELVAMDTPLDFRVVPRALQVLVPANRAGEMPA